jgi:tetratricopeptide (TPR) repeat protein
MMRILIFLFLFVKIVSAVELEGVFQKGNEHYLKGEYQESIKIYESIAEKGYQGKSLYYNLGNAYFRIGKIGLAILYYEKAKKLSPSDEDINYNLAFANSKIADKIETLPRFFLFDWWENSLALFSITGWTYTAYIFYLFILGAVGYYYFAGSLKGQRIAFYTGIISAFFLVLTIVLLVVNLNRELNYKYGIVVDPVVVVKFSPDQNSKDAFVVHEGLKVQAEDNVNDWVKIKLIDGKVGWLKNKDLKII